MAKAPTADQTTAGGAAANKSSTRLVGTPKTGSLNVEFLATE